MVQQAKEGHQLLTVTYIFWRSAHVKRGWIYYSIYDVSLTFDLRQGNKPPPGVHPSNMFDETYHFKPDGSLSQTLSTAGLHV
jgi:hypothetical protein